MKYLLDTSAFIFLAQNSNRLSAEVINAFENPNNELYFSSISIWELTLKHQLGKLELPNLPHKIIPKMYKDNDIKLLDFTYKDALQQSNLELIHRDPFDRMLISQAIENKLTVMTSDKIFQQYPVKILW